MSVVLYLTDSQRLALLDVIASSLTAPLRMEVFVDVVRGTETRPEDLLTLVMDAPAAGALTLYAWVGEDELGSGAVGLKQAIVPAGVIPIVAVRRDKIDRAEIVAQLQSQADTFRKPIRLIECVEAATLRTLAPRPRGLP